MKIAKKMAFPGLIILCAALVLGACAPDLDTAAPTEAIQIINIPAKIVNTASPTAISAYTGTELNNGYLFYLNDVNYEGQRATYKVYVQLSAGMTASSGYAAMGEALIADGQKIGDTYTVTITNLTDQNGNPFKGSNWAFESVLISPEKVDTIFDIDAKVGTIGPSLSPTVVFDWNTLSPKKLMKIEDYKKLFGKELSSDYGIIIKDTQIKPGITGAKNHPWDLSPSLIWNHFKQ